MKESQSYFEAHAEVNEFHKTSDGMHFFNKVDAEAHAPRLEDNTITTVTRAEFEAWLSQQETAPPATTDGAGDSGAGGDAGTDKKTKKK